MISDCKLPQRSKSNLPALAWNRMLEYPSLINPITVWWNYRLIMENFNEEEAAHICSLALSPIQQADRLVWSGTKNGVFTVRTAYHLELNNINQIGVEPSLACENEVFWKSLWSLQVPGVLKQFAWKCCSEALPTKANLYRRCVLPDHQCPLCENQSESIFHILWSCPSSVTVWQ
jgi:hypothetical protein